MEDYLTKIQSGIALEALAIIYLFMIVPALPAALDGGHFLYPQ